MADFVNAFCDWLGLRATLSREAAPFALFGHDAVEIEGPPANYADPYSVVRQYGGDSHANDPTMSVSLQCMTVGTDTAAAMARATAIHDALLDADGDFERVPVANVAITGFVFSVGNLRPPGQIGRDTKERAQIVFNFDVSYYAA